jgi:putative DNA methylase
VRHYGRLIRARAQEKIGHLYPKVRLPKEHGGGDANVIAWLFARTVKCSNPACSARMPMVRSFWLARKKPTFIHAHPVLDKEKRTVRFEIETGGEPKKRRPKGSALLVLRKLCWQNGVAEDGTNIASNRFRCSGS